MRNSFYVFTFVGKKLISRTKPDKERTVAKPLQLKKKKKVYRCTHKQKAEKKIKSMRVVCMCVYIYI